MAHGEARRQGERSGGGARVGFDPGAACGAHALVHAVRDPYPLLTYQGPNLTGSYYTIDIDLIEGYNNIEFVALNEGESSPNTAQLSVFDENGVNLSNNKWLITTGYKARLVVFKK